MNIQEWLQQGRPLNVILHGDCMDLMKYLQWDEFDLAVVDPPYGVNITKECMGGRKTIKPDVSKKWDIEKPDEYYFNELFRISKNQIIFGGNYFDLPPSRYFCIWDKGETMYGRDFAEAEFAWVGNGGTRIFKLSPNQLKRIHPTQKPVALYRWILQNYAKPGDKIIDTHSGSGSLACACHLEGFSFLAVEKDYDYLKASIERFNELKSQGRLF